MVKMNGRFSKSRILCFLEATNFDVEGFELTEKRKKCILAGGKSIKRKRSRELVGQGPPTPRPETSTGL